MPKNTTAIASSFLSKLDGTGYFPEGSSSSELSKSEMGDLITIILQWDDANGVEFSERSTT
ncbi:MAG: recombination protein NinB [Paracoccaceae bacterium]